MKVGIPYSFRVRIYDVIVVETKYILTYCTIYDNLALSDKSF